MTGKRVGYTNWKDASPNGNCAYLFTKVRQNSQNLGLDLFYSFPIY